MMSIRTAAGIALLASALPLAAPAAAVALTGTYTQNFDSLAAAGSNQSALPAGWAIVESGSSSAVNNLYSASTGSSTAGDTYSFGSSGSGERALGSLTSGTLDTMFGAIFQNATGSTISALTLGYFGEQWRRGNTPADALTFEYSLNATSIASGTWTAVSALDFTTIAGVASGTLNGNLAANRTQIGATIGGLSIQQGASFGIRWTDFDATGTDDGLAIDDLTLTAQSAVPETATWLMLVAGFGGLGAALRRRPRANVRFV